MFTGGYSTDPGAAAVQSPCCVHDKHAFPDKHTSVTNSYVREILFTTAQTSVSGGLTLKLKTRNEDLSLCLFAAQVATDLLSNVLAIGCAGFFHDQVLISVQPLIYASHSGHGVCRRQSRCFFNGSRKRTAAAAREVVGSQVHDRQACSCKYFQKKLYVDIQVIFLIS